MKVKDCKETVNHFVPFSVKVKTLQVDIPFKRVAVCYVNHRNKIIFFTGDTYSVNSTINHGLFKMFSGSIANSCIDVDHLLRD